MDQAQSAAEAERERVAAARQAARTSAVLVQLEGPRSSNASAGPSSEEPVAPAAATEPCVSSAGVSASQQRKIPRRRAVCLESAEGPWFLVRE